MEPQPPSTPNNQPAVTAPKKRSRRRRIIVTVLIVAVVVVAGGIAYGLLHKKSSAPQDFSDYDNSKYDQYAQVSMTKQGFTPSSLTIQPNTAVFVHNADSSALTLALNDPTQKDGPAISKDNDPVLPNNKTLAADATSVHVYEKPATYIFHEAEHPESNLVITVKKSSSQQTPSPTKDDD